MSSNINTKQFRQSKHIIAHQEASNVHLYKFAYCLLFSEVETSTEDCTVF